MNALVAYQDGATGSGIRIGIIDSGIDLQSEEFGDCSRGTGTGSCRISSISADVGGNGTIDDEGGHGTAVAFALAGRRNGAGTHGVAFDSQLVVLRADSPGSCATYDPDDEDSGCSFDDRDIAQGLDIATNAGARVVNISLGGNAPSSALIDAVTRATAAGVIIVMSAGNDGEANPDPFTAPATNAAQSHGLIIIAGSVDGNDQISGFSNRAGTGQNFYLTAVGERVRAPDQENTPFLWSGTSFSAPQISGAVALLAQAFPNMTPGEIVQLLFTTARDAGDPGIDAIYGRGVLDLTRAFQPVGQTFVAGTQAVASNRVNATLSAPMGDARQSGLGMVVLDGFDRAFAMDFANTIRRAAPGKRLTGAIAGRQRSYALGIGDIGVAVRIAPGREGVRIDRLAIGSDDAERARLLAASVTGRLGSDLQYALGASESGGALTARLAGRAEPAFLIAGDPATGSGFESDSGTAVALRHRIGSWGLSVAAEYGDVRTRALATEPDLLRRRERLAYDRMTVALDRRFGGLRIGVTGSRLHEEDSVLGARFGGALGAAGADSWFLDLAARQSLGDGFTFGASWRQGWTQARLRGGIIGSGAIRTDGFAADIGKRGVFGRGDQLGLRVSQPLRVRDGGLDLTLPAGWDYASESVNAWSHQRVNLAPEGREIDVEASYSARFFGGDWGANLFWRRDPGNIAAMPDDVGGAVRFNISF
ncbi:S8 family serine peptidase [Sphingosinithalassobacter tenebrarum]|uniref:S8 family serine peptidase n=2 Tax=Stakelama tenebrarum TaxID=2711215 RepID=A0A6G6YAQ8_9SPHN|nr:S8 family serine peptidase [Sphingosinithalassobacter tenebrarum]